MALRRCPAGGASNRPMLRWLKTVVVNDWGEGAHDASGGDREGVPEWSVQVGPVSTGERNGVI